MHHMDFLRPTMPDGTMSMPNQMTSLDGSNLMQQQITDCFHGGDAWTSMYASDVNPMKQIEGMLIKTRATFK